MIQRTLAGLVLLGAALLTGCAGQAGNTADGTATTPAVSSAAGDPNAAGRAVAAGTTTGSPTSPPPAMPGGAMAMCANETLGESMARAVDAGSSILLAAGGFTGTTTVADGEIGVVYSQVQLTTERALAGPEMPNSFTAWVYGDLAATGGAAVTGEASSLWARGGRMIVIVDGQSEPSGLDAPLIRVAPVVGDEVILSWVGCWSTNGVQAREFDGAVDIFDERGLTATGLDLYAVSLDDFEAVLATG